MFCTYKIITLKEKLIIPFIIILGTDRTQLLSYVVSKDNCPNVHVCTLCGHEGSGGKTNVLNHVESVHFPVFNYSCMYCSKQYTSRNAFNVRVSRHKNKMAQSRSNLLQ